VKTGVVLHNGLICTEQSSVWWQTTRDNKTASKLWYFTVWFYLL